METLHQQQFYTCLESMAKVYDSLVRVHAYHARTMEEHLEWKTKVRQKLFEITGLARMPRCNLLPRKISVEAMDGYTREKYLIQTETDVWMPFYILIPGDMKTGERKPCFIAAHGHSSGGKYSTAGRVDIPPVRKMIEEVNYDYGIKFVQKGFMTFCHDARGFGERREISDQSDDDKRILDSSCMPLNNKYICMGRSLTGMWTWDIMRLMDYIETRDDCDPDRIGCGGLSGGGLQTLWAAALDERIQCSVISGYFYGYKESLLLMANHCCCNFIPHLYENVDMGDLGALIAPRALLVESGIKDPLNGCRGIPNAIEQVAITKRAYQLMNAEDAIYHHIFDGEHLWHGGKTYDFADKWLKHD